jgi:hypothetical protein
MKLSNSPIVILLLGVLASSAALAASKKPALDDWMEDSLIPAVVSRLKTHPRFRNEIVRFVVLQDGKPSATTNTLALALRDRLQDAVIDRSGIRVGWQVDRKSFDRRNEQSRVDCTASDVNYYIGLELEELRGGRFTVSVRALDVEQQSWVSGFSEYWQGTLTTMQYRAYREPASDQAYLGQRTVPFEDTQTDLLAAQLAYDLGCSLLRELSGEYVAQISGDIRDPSNETLALVGNNLADYKALKITASSSGTNSIIEARAHQVDNDLYQYWVTITPIESASDMPTISASAYIYLPETFLPASPTSYAQATKTSEVTPGATLIRSLRIVSGDSTSLCDASTNGSRRVYGRDAGRVPGQCFALETQAVRDSVVFFLYHQVNNGLVRLAGQDCSARSDARIARQGQALLFPLSMDSAGPPSWLPGKDWMIEPDADTFYAIASSNTKAARALGQHFARLPMRCGSGVRPGLEGAELRRWFSELNAITQRWRSEIDWRSVRVKNVF